MVGFTDRVEKQLLDHLFGKAILTPPPSIHLGLSLTPPTDAGGNVTEPPASAGYQRIATTPASWAPALEGSPTTMHNLVQLAFGPATANWGQIVALVGYDAASGGNVLFVSRPIEPPVTINLGGTYVIAPGDFPVQLGDPQDVYA